MVGRGVRAGNADTKKLRASGRRPPHPHPPTMYTHAIFWATAGVTWSPAYFLACRCCTFLLIPHQPTLQPTRPPTCGMNSHMVDSLSLKYMLFHRLITMPRFMWATPSRMDIFIFIELRNGSSDWGGGHREGGRFLESTVCVGCVCMCVSGGGRVHNASWFVFVCGWVGGWGVIFSLSGVNMWLWRSAPG